MSSRKNNRQAFALGADLSPVSNSLKYFGLIARRVFDKAILDVSDIEQTVKILQQRGKRFDKLYAHISPSCSYVFEGAEKSYETAAATLYDFVDGFLVSGFSHDIADVVDKLLNLRLINDEYREIFLLADENCTGEEIDSILEYVHLSDIEGLVLSNPNQLRYVRSVDASARGLTLYVNNVVSPEEYCKVLDEGADAAFVKMKSVLSFHYVLEGVIIRLQAGWRARERRRRRSGSQETSKAVPPTVR